MYHKFTYWQFMAAAMFSGHFLLQHGLGTKLVQPAVCLVGSYRVSSYIYQVAYTVTLGDIYVIQNLAVCWNKTASCVLAIQWSLPRTDTHKSTD